MKKIAVSVLVIAGLLSVLLSGCRSSGASGGGTAGSETAGGGTAGRGTAGGGTAGGGTAGEGTAGGGTAGRGTAGEGTAGTLGTGTPGTVQEPVVKAKDDIETKNSAMERDPESEIQISALPYQFVRGYGIIKSEYPIYELDAVIESEIPLKEKSVSLTSVICQKQEMIVSIVFDDYEEVSRIPAGGEPPADGMYYTLRDGSMIDAKRYQNELWVSGEGLFLTGPGIPEAGIKPQESMYASYPDYFEEYGNKRYTVEARFEIPSSLDYDNNLSGYRLQLLDFETPLEFALKRVPEYGTLEELAEEEHGSMDTHDGISIISMGESVKEGILVSWYVYSEEGERQISVIYKPPSQEADLPAISGKDKIYPIKQLSANPYWDNSGFYRLSEVRRYGRRTRCLFDVPEKKQNGALQIMLPGITFLNYEESPNITLTIPENYEEVNEDIPWEEGSVRILGITRMKEPQTSEISDGKGGTTVMERPAVYIDVEAVHKDKNLALKNLICQRKSRGTRWEHERYDFDGKGNLSGFRIFYDEGDTSVTLKFSKAAFYWNQPYVMALPQLK